MINTNAKLISELQEILSSIGSEKIWRPVIINGNTILSDGVGDDDDGISADIQSLNFSDKSVIDLGCNFGYYSFMARDAGARRVLGIDIDSRIIRGCNILKKIYDSEGTFFRAQDITQLNGENTYDVGMMVDFIGKQFVHSGLLVKFLDSLERVSRREIIISLRPTYRISKHLQGDLSSIIEHYTKKYVKDDHFLLMEYVKDRFAHQWNFQLLRSTNNSRAVIKETVHLTRKI